MVTIISNTITNGSIWFLGGTLTGTTTPGQSAPGSNGSERVTSHSPKLQDLNLTFGCSLVSYLRLPIIFYEKSYPLTGYAVSVFLGSQTGCI